ncbi:MAG TPA: polysaccharide biosynthesis/export family protein [Myxococcota bacterium]|nr:polysaccharide biosynthesis/export family protein [Myxococcota bacterium]
MGLHSHTFAARTAIAIPALVGLLLGVGCASTPRPEPEPSPELAVYKVGAPDTLVVTILPDPIVTETVVVRPDGLITIQLIGDVQAAGRTPNEIAGEIEERIGRYKRGARATVAVQKAESSAVTVLGEVRLPGRFALVKLTRVTEALGYVGGPTTFAQVSGIRVLRPGPLGTVVQPVDFGAIRDGDMTTNFALQGGDIVYVPPTLLAKIGYVVQQIFFPFQPIIGVGQATAGTLIAR